MWETLGQLFMCIQRPCNITTASKNGLPDTSFLKEIGMYKYIYCHKCFSSVFKLENRRYQFPFVQKGYLEYLPPSYLYSFRWRIIVQYVVICCISNVQLVQKKECPQNEMYSFSYDIFALEEAEYNITLFHFYV